MVNWYVVYVNVRHEKKVVKKLSEFNIEAYSPVVKKLQQWSDRKKWVEFPMISGYVFIKTNLALKETILMNSAILAFVKFNGLEAVIPEREINILKSIELTGFDVTQENDCITLHDEVEINQGQLKGIFGTVVKINNDEYVQITLNSLHQSVKVKVPKAILKLKNIEPLRN